MSGRELLQQGGEAAFLQPLVPANTAILSPCFAPGDILLEQEVEDGPQPRSPPWPFATRAAELGTAGATLRQQLRVTHPFRLVAIRTLVIFQPTPAMKGRTASLCLEKDGHRHQGRVITLGAGLHGTWQKRQEGKAGAFPPPFTGQRVVRGHGNQMGDPFTFHVSHEDISICPLVDPVLEGAAFEHNLRGASCHQAAICLGDTVLLAGPAQVFLHCGIRDVVGRSVNQVQRNYPVWEYTDRVSTSWRALPPQQVEIHTAVCNPGFCLAPQYPFHLRVGEEHAALQDVPSTYGEPFHHPLGCSAGMSSQQSHSTLLTRAPLQNQGRLVPQQQRSCSTHGWSSEFYIPGDANRRVRDLSHLVPMPPWDPLPGQASSGTTASCFPVLVVKGQVTEKLQAALCCSERRAEAKNNKDIASLLEHGSSPWKHSKSGRK